MTIWKGSHVEAYVFRRRRGIAEFLVLRRSRSRRKLPGVWQPVSGKRKWGETALEAAAREVWEETRLVPARWWALEQPIVYFDALTDAIEALPVFAAEIDPSDRVVLSSEHEDFEFLTAPKAARRYLWNAQRKALDAVGRDVFGDKRLARELEVTDLVPRSRAIASAPAARTKIRRGG